FANLLGINSLKGFWSNYERMEGWITLLHLLGYFVVMTSVLDTRKLWNRFFNTSLAVSVWVGLYGISQIAGWTIAHQGTSRLDISFGNASYLAIYTIFHIFLALFLLVRHSFLGRSSLGKEGFIRHKKWNDWVVYTYIGVILLNIYILYHTATRGAILGFIGSILLISFLLAIFEKENKNLRKTGIGILVGTLLFVGGFIALKDASFIRNNSILNRFATISLEESTTKSRFMIWNMAWQGIKERPILGWGQESFNYIFNETYDPGMYDQEEWFDRTHNVFMDWLVVGGFLGLLAYLSLFGTLLYYLWRKKHDNGFSNFEKSIFTGLLAGYFVHNLFVFDNITSYILFFTILAFIHNQIDFNKEEKEKKDIFLDNLDEDTKLKTFVPVLIFLMIFSLYFFNVKGALANRNLLLALSPHPEIGLSENLRYFEKALSYNSYANQEIREQLLQFVVKTKDVGANQDTKNNLFELAKLEAEKEIERDPENARIEVLIGSFFSNFGKNDEALRHFERALTLSPNKQSIHFGMGYIYITQKEYQKAFDIFKEAYKLDSRYEKAKSLYAISSIYAGKNDVVMSLYGTDIIPDPNFLSAYRDTRQLSKMIQVAEAIVENTPNNPQSHISLSAAYFENGQKSKSIEEIRKAIELDPNFKAQGELFINRIQSGQKP
ncbi:MAG: O-antigen ligase family protein, partial [Candidatus Pacebacteria bacterium]|nr:O-antigen ligase family protein [Candidatus Paceibacterota bacterium]